VIIWGYLKKPTGAQGEESQNHRNGCGFQKVTTPEGKKAWGGASQLERVKNSRGSLPLSQSWGGDVSLPEGGWIYKRIRRKRAIQDEFGGKLLSRSSDRNARKMIYRNRRRPHYSKVATINIIDAQTVTWGRGGNNMSDNTPPGPPALPSGCRRKRRLYKKKGGVGPLLTTSFPNMDPLGKRF